MTVGGMAYRIGRTGVMGLGSSAFLRASSIGAGLAAEVSAFDMTHRGLTTVSGRGGPVWPPALGSPIGGRPHGGAPTNHGESNLWRWSGNGGLRQGILQSLITFGALKSAGRLAQGENLVAQHVYQDSAMVLGHQASGVLGITPSPTGTFAEQFLHAEATNLQIGAGMAMAHGFAPGIHGLERGLDLSLKSSDRATLRPEDQRNSGTDER